MVNNKIVADKSFTKTSIRFFKNQNLADLPNHMFRHMRAPFIVIVMHVDTKCLIPLGVNHSTARQTCRNIGLPFLASGLPF